MALLTDPAPTNPPSMKSDCNAVDGYNWDTHIAYAICMAESGGNPSAVGYNSNGTADRGLMQINSIHADMVDGDLTSLIDPSINIKTAYILSKDGSDWTPWSTYNNGNYRKYL